MVSGDARQASFRRDKLLAGETQHPYLEAAKAGSYSEQDLAGIVHAREPRTIKSQKRTLIAHGVAASGSAANHGFENGGLPAITQANRLASG